VAPKVRRKIERVDVAPARATVAQLSVALQDGFDDGGVLGDGEVAVKESSAHSDGVDLKNKFKSTVLCWGTTGGWTQTGVVPSTTTVLCCRARPAVIEECDGDSSAMAAAAFNSACSLKKLSQDCGPLIAKFLRAD